PRPAPGPPRPAWPTGHARHRRRGPPWWLRAPRPPATAPSRRQATRASEAFLQAWRYPETQASKRCATGCRGDGGVQCSSRDRYTTGADKVRVDIEAPIAVAPARPPRPPRSEEHTSELQSLAYLVCRLLLEKK